MNNLVTKMSRLAVSFIIASVVVNQYEKQLRKAKVEGFVKGAILGIELAESHYGPKTEKEESK